MLRLACWCTHTWDLGQGRTQEQGARTQKDHVLCALRSAESTLARPWDRMVSARSRLDVVRESAHDPKVHTRVVRNSHGETAERETDRG